jgi:hypothetical protein
MLTCGNTVCDGDLEAPSFSSNFMYTTDHKWTVFLLKILDYANAPDNTFGEVLEWERSTTSNNYSCFPIGGLALQECGSLD